MRVVLLKRKALGQQKWHGLLLLLLLPGERLCEGQHQRLRQGLLLPPWEEGLGLRLLALAALALMRVLLLCLHRQLRS